MSRSRLRASAPAVSAAVVTLIGAAWWGMRPGTWPDWFFEAVPAVHALLAGHPGRFLQLAPAYGGSLILRAPFMLLTKLWHGGEASVYIAGAVPCLAAIGALGVWLAAQLRQRGCSRLGRGVTLLVCVGNPLMLPALHFGHPEEILGAVLCVVAVMCAVRDRPVWAGVALGLAIANKEWAVLCAGPVLVALPRARVRALVISGGIAGALTVPLLLARGGGLAGQAAAAAVPTGSIFQPWQLWWFFGSHAHILHGAHGAIAERTPPAWIASLAHPLIVAIMPPLTALYAWARRGHRRRAATDALLLLALLLLLRCVLDPWDISYYALPCLIALLCWEVSSFTRPPLLALAASLVGWLILKETGDPALHLSPDVQAIAFTVVAGPCLLALTMAVYLPGAVRRVLLNRPRDATVAPATA